MPVIPGIAIVRFGGRCSGALDGLIDGARNFARFTFRYAN
jgi:hypothetical protein